MEKKQVIDALLANKSIDIRYPLKYCPEADDYVVELLDCLSAYLFPLVNGLWKEDILDFLSTMNDCCFFDFLHFKRYIILQDDFDLLFEKYFTNSDATFLTLRIDASNFHAFEDAVTKKGASIDALVKFSNKNTIS